MNKQLLLSLVVILVTGCSTVERYSYYTPEAPPSNVVGPRKPGCGWMNFGGLPDEYKAVIGTNTVFVSAYQDIHPYLGGPWFASVIPVFPPITSVVRASLAVLGGSWVEEVLMNDNLRIEIYSTAPNIVPLFEGARFTVTISQSGGESIGIAASSVTTRDRAVTLVFSTDETQTVRFIFQVLRGQELMIEVPFKKAGRWAWTQWTPNC